MPYTGYDFSAASPNDSRSYGFDFTNALPSGDNILEATFSLFPTVGTDADPGSHLVGSAQIIGLIASQTIAGLLVGVTYCVTCTIVTLSGQTIEVSGGLSCVPECIGARL